MVERHFYLVTTVLLRILKKKRIDCITIMASISGLPSVKNHPNTPVIVQTLKYTCV